MSMAWYFASINVQVWVYNYDTSKLVACRRYVQMPGNHIYLYINMCRTFTSRAIYFHISLKLYMCMVLIPPMRTDPHYTITNTFWGLVHEYFSFTSPKFMSVTLGITDSQNWKVLEISYLEPCFRWRHCSLEWVCGLSEATQKVLFFF